MSENRLLITEDGSHTIYLPELKETYHSTHGAIRESEHVFIRQGLEHALQHGKKTIKIFELGFGTGLNALLSWIYAERNQIAIHYHTIEAFPLTREDIEVLNYPSLIDAADDATKKFREIHRCDWNELVELSPYFQLNKIEMRIEEFHTDMQFDVCYFDAFAPSKQAEMWEIAILEKVKNMLVPQGILVTYCAKGQLKRDLKSLSFEVESLPGPPGKKEMVRAVRR
jgi:tRNA U34 5-methylaminomethyl-2-thiouridine-forming methyltransferase MnmC